MGTLERGEVHRTATADHEEKDKEAQEAGLLK